MLFRLRIPYLKWFSYFQNEWKVIVQITIPKTYQTLFCILQCLLQEIFEIKKKEKSWATALLVSTIWIGMSFVKKYWKIIWLYTVFILLRGLRRKPILIQVLLLFSITTLLYLRDILQFVKFIYFYVCIYTKMCVSISPFHFTIGRQSSP